MLVSQPFHPACNHLKPGLLQDNGEGSVAGDIAKEHGVRQFAVRDLQGLTFSQKTAVDRVYDGIKALQVRLTWHSNQA